MKPDTLFYANTGKGSNITRELISNLFTSLTLNLKSDSFKDFVSKSRVPNERELYGIFIKSLLDSCQEHLGHIATEFQVERGDYPIGEDAKGRVDVFFDYRSVSYLIELKVGRVNAKYHDREPKIRTKDLWVTAIQQLNQLKIDSVYGLLQKTTVKLPITLYFFDTKDPIKDGSIDHEQIHKNIYAFIRSDDAGNDIEEFYPDFSQYSKVPCLHTRLRKTSLVDGKNEHNNFIYGFSLFAKQLP